MGAPVGIQGTKSGGSPRPGYEELFNDFLQGMKLFRANLRNATSRIC